MQEEPCSLAILEVDRESGREFRFAVAAAGSAAGDGRQDGSTTNGETAKNLRTMRSGRSIVRRHRERELLRRFSRAMTNGLASSARPTIFSITLPLHHRDRLQRGGFTAACSFGRMSSTLSATR